MFFERKQSRKLEDTKSTTFDAQKHNLRCAEAQGTVRKSTTFDARPLSKPLAAQDFFSLKNSNTFNTIKSIYISQ
jgi:hypothetical protein